MVTSVLPTAVGLLALLASDSSAPTPPDATRAARDATVGALSLDFVENRGQVDRRADYYLPAGYTSVYFSRGGLRRSLPRRHAADRRYGLKLGARLFAVRRRRFGVRDLWPGIDSVYSGTGTQLKYSFLVKPGADPDAILDE